MAPARDPSFNWRKAIWQRNKRLTQYSGSGECFKLQRYKTNRRKPYEIPCSAAFNFDGSSMRHRDRGGDWKSIQVLARNRGAGGAEREGHSTFDEGPDRTGR